MTYHMNEDDRVQFLNSALPQNLPIELTTNLPDNLKTFLKDKYGPAYVSMMLSHAKVKDSDWRYPLTDAERDKIWYWWTGSVRLRAVAGHSCLPSSGSAD